MAQIMGYNSPKELMASVNDAILACYPDESDRRRVLSTLQSGRNLEQLETCFEIVKESCAGQNPKSDHLWALRKSVSSGRLLCRHH